MNDLLKPRINFDDEPAAAVGGNGLRPSVDFTDAPGREFVPVALGDENALDELETAEQEQVVSAALSPKRSLWRRMLVAGMTLFGISALAQGGQSLYHAWLNQDWIALGGIAAGTLIVGAGVGSLAVEWRRLYRLRQRAQTRDQAQALLDGHRVGNGRAFCEQLARQAGLGMGHPAMQRWLASLHESQNDREVVVLYAKLVQPALDARARREISHCAAEAALIVAVSPLALVDMAFIAWRNLRLVNRIARLYGIELGYFSRIRLFKLVLLNVAFAGASELVREIGMDWMSQDLTARLSARAAQGLGVGLLTARLGIRAMALCRPLPWLDDKPRLGDFRRELLAHIREKSRAGS
ncbi:TIGR01620 family protein [Musicola paradisiaca]|uniref:UPF0283 membrane protein Dd703_1726 n=1 Tax=Musicola paradisiaca (strain Ech703) TaxID=579405 RepID=C6C4E9_MUSP7|nr:TIGR01620 family protein [Musicola paradisiaca]ACS85523.1 conserved hypothetical protein [Musicola paradisiaca Ech703]